MLRKPTNSIYAVTICKENDIVGHVPFNISSFDIAVSAKRLVLLK